MRKKNHKKKHASRKKLRGGGFKLKKALALGLAGALAAGAAGSLYAYKRKQAHDILTADIESQLQAALDNDIHV